MGGGGIGCFPLTETVMTSYCIVKNVFNCNLCMYLTLIFNCTTHEHQISSLWENDLYSIRHVLHFALVTVFQSIFQCCQHHVDVLPAAVASHQSHAEHLENDKNIQCKTHRQEQMCLDDAYWHSIIIFSYQTN